MKGILNVYRATSTNTSAKPSAKFCLCCLVILRKFDAQVVCAALRAITLVDGV